ncbi:uncharacterized protein LOC102802324 [Saccoglossus kowalevskii]
MDFQQLKNYISLSKMNRTSNEVFTSSMGTKSIKAIEVTVTKLTNLTEVHPKNNVPAYQFFVSSINTYDEDELMPKGNEIDLEEVSDSIQDALNTAASASQKLQELNHEMVTYVHTLTGGKAATKSKKKLEKALSQAKEDIQSLTEKLLGAQTEIEDKEDQMTKLYKQIDIKNLEIQKQKAQTEAARDKLKQLDELRLVIRAKEDEIEGYRKKLADLQLNLQQIEQSREASQAKLRAANEDNQNTIEKLQFKLTQALVAIEDNKTELKKEHEGVVIELKRQHSGEIERLKGEYEEKIRKLEATIQAHLAKIKEMEEELERVKHWVSDSEDDDKISGRKSSRSHSLLTPSVSNTSTIIVSPSVSMESLSTLVQPKLITEHDNDMTELNADDFDENASREIGDKKRNKITANRLNPKSGDVSSKPPSRKKSDQFSSRQNTNLSTATKSSVEKQGSSDSMKVPTPQPVSRGKSNLETVQEVPFDDKIPLEDEEKWAALPQEKLRSGFKQYRKEYRDNQHRWESERQVLIDQVEQSQRLQADAEKEADDAMLQLEALINEHEKLVRDKAALEEKLKSQTEPEAEAEPKKEVKRLTPEQRAILNLDNSTLKTPESKQDDDIGQVEDGETQTTPLPSITDHSQQTSRAEMYRDLTQLLPDSSPVPPTSSQTVATDKATGVPSEIPSEESQPQSESESQKDLISKLKQQMEDRRTVRRLSKSTSMHGSLLSAKSRPETATTDDVPFADDDGEPASDNATPPLYQPSTPPHRMVYSTHTYFSDTMSSDVTPSLSDGDTSTLSQFLDISDSDMNSYDSHTVSLQGNSDSDYVELVKLTSKGIMDCGTVDVLRSVSISGHPVVQEYLKTYQTVTDFRDELVKILTEKELMSHAEQLQDTASNVEFDKDRTVHLQITEMSQDVHKILREISEILSSLINNEFDPRVSSLGSRGMTNQTLTTQHSQPTMAADTQSVHREESNMSSMTELVVRDLQDALSKLKDEKKRDKKEYEEQLNHNAVVMMEMQDMITELQRELNAAAATSGRYGSNLPSREQDSAIMFTRLDWERNQRALKKGVASEKVQSEVYNNAVDAMEQYVDLPSQRLVHLVKKYTHHVQMKQIEEGVRQSQNLDDDVFNLLDKMEALQNTRAQRWNDRMDEMGEERLRLAHILMDTLSMIEEESGIFLIKPIYSWKGKGYLSKYTGKLSNNYRPPKMISRTMTPLREGTPMNTVPAPTPASIHASKSTQRPSTRQLGGGDGPGEYDEVEVPMQGMGMMSGQSSEPMWAMTSSQVDPATSNKIAANMLTTPRLLELDVNRMLIGQNTISANIKPSYSDDRLVNASNTNLRSYMTIARPSANPSPNTKPRRPHSTPGGVTEVQTPPSTPYLQPSSAGHGSRLRSKSMEGFAQSQPLPPIKVPSQEGGLRRPHAKSSASSGRSKSVSIAPSPIETPITPVHQASPPNTPPGSSVEPTPLPTDTPIGHITKVVARSPSQSTTHSFTAVEAES